LAVVTEGTLLASVLVHVRPRSPGVDRSSRPVRPSDPLEHHDAPPVELAPLRGAPIPVSLAVLHVDLELDGVGIGWVQPAVARAAVELCLSAAHSIGRHSHRVQIATAGLAAKPGPRGCRRVALTGGCGLSTGPRDRLEIFDESGRDARAHPPRRHTVHGSPALATTPLPSVPNR
jgi:hypothetical protein